MENKYYTPDIKDLYIGYNTEIYTQSDKLIKQSVWKPIIIGLDNNTNINYINKYIKSNNIKTKYLDVEDIESLGWRKMKQYTQGIWFEKSKYKLYYESPEKIQICVGTMPLWLNYLYMGSCKSINELKTILNLLRI